MSAFIIYRPMVLGGGGGGGGITSINGDSSTAQLLTVGTAGTDFAIVDAGGGSHVFNLPTASASNRGALSSADWTTFNNKQPAGAYLTSIAVTTANGISGVSSGGTTPSLTLSLGAITPSSVNASGTVLGSNLSGTNTGDVTLGTANGLSLTGQALSLGLSSTSTTGALTSVDWNTFNNKANSFNTGNLTEGSSSILTIAGGTGAVVGSGTQITVKQASGSQSGYLSSADWTTFNNKGSGTVTAISVVSTNGLAGSVATATTTPAITLSTTITGILQGNGTAISAAATTGSGSVVLATAPTMTNPVVGTQSQLDGSTKAASTSYVDTAVANAVAGVNPAVAVQAATTAASDTSGFTYNNGVSGIGATLTSNSTNTALTVDGFTFTALNQRLLVKNDTQTPSGAFNGIYYVTQLQALGLPIILTRALDYDTPSDINNTGAIPVINGTVNTTTSWVQNAQITTVGTSPLSFTQFSRNPNVPLGVTNGGTGTSTAFTQGSVVFAGASGTYAQDNSNLFWDASNHRLGIGTSSPGQAGIANSVSIVGATTNRAMLEMGNASSITVGTTANINFYNASTEIAQISIFPDQVNADSGQMAFYTLAHGGSLTKRLTIDPNGALLPNNIHNNGGTGNASNQAIASGTYTPTNVNSGGNVNIATTPSWSTSYWMRVGNVVTVAGSVTVNASSSNANTSFSFSLPIAATIVGSSVAGIAAAAVNTPNTVGRITGDSTNNCAQFLTFVPGSGSSQWTVQFTYLIA